MSLQDDKCGCGKHECAGDDGGECSCGKEPEKVKEAAESD